MATATAHESDSDLKGRAAAKGAFPPLHGPKNSTVDVPDHGRLPPYTHHHAREEEGEREVAEYRRLPPWGYHHGPRRNESLEVGVEHRRLPSFVLNRPATTVVRVVSSTVVRSVASEAATSTVEVAGG